MAVKAEVEFDLVFPNYSNFSSFDKDRIRSILAQAQDAFVGVLHSHNIDFDGNIEVEVK